MAIPHASAVQKAVPAHMRPLSRRELGHKEATSRRTVNNPRYQSGIDDSIQEPCFPATRGPGTSPASAPPNSYGWRCLITSVVSFSDRRGKAKGPSAPPASAKRQQFGNERNMCGHKLESASDQLCELPRGEPAVPVVMLISYKVANFENQVRKEGPSNRQAVAVWLGPSFPISPALCRASIFGSQRRKWDRSPADHSLLGAIQSRQPTA